MNSSFDLADFVAGLTESGQIELTGTFAFGPPVCEVCGGSGVHCVSDVVEIERVKDGWRFVAENMRHWYCEEHKPQGIPIIVSFLSADD